jgi:hypothetical protein
VATWAFSAEAVLEHRRAPVWPALVLASCLGAEAAEPPPSPSGLDAGEATLARFLARPDEPVERYHARRHMQVETRGDRAWMDVRTELDPRGFRFTVEAQGGSRLLLEKSLVSLLRAEQEAHASGQASRSALTAENYQLRAAEPAADGLVRLRALPRRRESTLVDGLFIVTPDTADLLRVEGALARSPSFWAREVAVSRHYARVCGHRVVVRLESLARIRFLGPTRLVVTFDYESIDGQPVEPSTRLAAVAGASTE